MSLAERTIVNGLAVRTLADGRVKVEGQAPMMPAEADAFLAAHPVRPIYKPTHTDDEADDGWTVEKHPAGGWRKVRLA